MSEVQAFGKTYTFGEKVNQIKDTVVDENGFTTRFVFRNGDYREQRFDKSHPLFVQLAAHGADQKYGDYNAGVKDVEDMVGNWDELNSRLASGDWKSARESSGLSGVSTLVKALVAVSRKPDGSQFTVDEVRAQLKATREAENGHKAIAWLRSQPKVAAEIARIESEKAAKAAEKGKGTIDTGATASAFGLG